MDLSVRHAKLPLHMRRRRRHPITGPMLMTFHDTSRIRVKFNKLIHLLQLESVVPIVA